MEDLENAEDVEENMRCKYLHQIKNLAKLSIAGRRVGG